jgi:HlyD family secretion protein
MGAVRLACNFGNVAMALGIVTCVTSATGCRWGDHLPPGFQGVVEFDERVMACEVPGRVRDVDVQRGDVVADGATLANLDDSLERLTHDARAQDEASARADLDLLQAGSRREDVESTAAEVRGALAQVTLARQNVTRVKALNATGSVAIAQLDQANADLARAIADHRSLAEKLQALQKGARPEEIARAQARLASLTLETALEAERIDRYVVKARGPGMVIDVGVKAGELAAVGTPVATIADVTHPYIDVFVSEGQLDGVRLGVKATVHVDSTPAGVDGAVEYVSPKTEFTPRFLFSEQERPHLVIRVRVRAQDPDQRLHAGVPAFVTFAR